LQDATNSDHDFVIIGVGLGHRFL